MDYLIKEGENKYFNSLVYYGEVTSSSSETGETQKQMGKFLSLLQVSCFSLKNNNLSTTLF